MNKINIFQEAKQHNKQRFEHNINQLKKIINLLENNGCEIDFKKLTILENSIEFKIRFPGFGRPEECGKDK